MKNYSNRNAACLCLASPYPNDHRISIQLPFTCTQLNVSISEGRVKQGDIQPQKGTKNKSAHTLLIIIGLSTIWRTDGAVISPQHFCFSLSPFRSKYYFIKIVSPAYKSDTQVVRTAVRFSYQRSKADFCGYVLLHSFLPVYDYVIS